jgi:succinate dehydrogenase / fumarate reductase cytochrome b subunit
MTSRERPLSPHLQVYRWQLTAVLSILHRATGIALGAGTTLLLWWLLAAASGAEAYRGFERFVRSPAGLVLLFLWTASYFYHLCNGIRHLAWDCGWGFDLKTTYRSGWAVLAAAAALTLIAWITGLARWS